MTLRERHGQAMLVRIQKFAKAHADLLNEPAQVLLPQLAAAIDRIEQFASQKVAGRGQRRSSVAQRRAISRQLRYVLADIARVARVLDRMTKSTYAKVLRLPRNLSYAALLTTGDAFVKVLTPTDVNAVFVGAGLPATFTDNLSAILANFRAAAETKVGGLLAHVEARRALVDATRDGILLARALDAILTPQLRTSDPALYAAWKAVLRLERGIKKSDAPAPVAETSAPAAILATEAPAAFLQNHAPASTTVASEALSTQRPTVIGCAVPGFHTHEAAPPFSRVDAAVTRGITNAAGPRDPV